MKDHICGQCGAMVPWSHIQFHMVWHFELEPERMKK